MARVARACEQADSPETIYRARADAFSADAIRLGRRFNRVANLRLVAFVASGVCLISGVAFPYSPPEIDRGPVYEFHLNHVLTPESPTALFRTEYEEL